MIEDGAGSREAVEDGLGEHLEVAGVGKIQQAFGDGRHFDIERAGAATVLGVHDRADVLLVEILEKRSDGVRGPLDHGWVDLR